MKIDEEFLRARQTGIGGSDVAAILGLSPFRTPLQVYLEKLGQLPSEPDNSRTKAGRVMEQVIAAMYAERQGVKLRRCNRTLRHPKYDWLIAHIDRDIVGQAKAVEIKNVSPRLAYLWGKDGAEDAAAEYYVTQPHAYMLVMDYPKFDVAAYFGGDDLRVYPMARDREMDDIIIGASHDFWHKHVLAGVPPEPDWSHKTTLPLLRRMYPGTNGETVQADESIAHWAEVAQQAADKSREYDKVADVARSHLLEFMGAAAVLRLDVARAFTRKLVTRTGYTVEPTQYIDTRFSKLKEKA